jgi:hypothetical protein
MEMYQLQEAIGIEGPIGTLWSGSIAVKKISTPNLFCVEVVVFAWVNAELDTLSINSWLSILTGNRCDLLCMPSIQYTQQCCGQWMVNSNL